MATVVSETNRVFGRFRLDPPNAQLWFGDRKIGLRPKTFDVLRYLIDHHGQLVTKAALLGAVWAGVNVSDSMPAICVKELRRALGDQAQTPQFIETVHRRGYRFIAAVTLEETGEPSREPGLISTMTSPIVVGRGEELARLKGWFANVRAGRRRVVFVSGEAGIGKTTFIEAFLDSLAQEGSARIARGQCVEQYGSGEPYMPVLSALSQLSRVTGGSRVVEILNRFAPTWLVQMPELLTSDERVRLHNETQGVTQQRMLREMMQALEELSAELPLVLVLEDLHWSDFSTLELISAFGRRSGPASLLVVGTYRPVEILAADHPLRRTKQELELHQQCEELRLRLLREEDIAEYLTRRLTGHQLTRLDVLAPIIHACTDGNPLFLVNMVDYLLLDTGLPARPEVSADDLAEKLRSSQLDALRNIRRMIEHNLELLSLDEQAVLEVASVAGVEFSAAALAAALKCPQAEIEESCIRLSRREQFISAQAPVVWPDGTVAAGFRFYHALYQEVLYSRLSAGQRAEFHRLIGTRQEAAYGERAAEAATELANHFKRANLHLKAIQYFQLAGQRAISRAAVIEARTHFAETIKLLHELPEGVARDRRELDLHLAIAPVLIAVIGGWYAGETERAWSRASELCARLDDFSALFPTIFGLYALHLVRGEVQAANGLANQLVSRAESTNDLGQMLYARIAMGITSYFMGDFNSALENLEFCNSTYQLALHYALILQYGFDVGVWSLCYTAATYWQLGYPERALRKCDEALALAEKQSHPLSLAQAELWTSIVRQMRGEASRVGEMSERLRSLSIEHGLTDWVHWAACLHGWGIAKQKRRAEGIVEIQEGEAALEARGLRVWRPYFLCMVADACLDANRIEDGLEALKDAAALANEHEEREHESQIYRLKGELLLKRSDADPQEVQACFQRAAEIARKQHAKSLELQAIISWARLRAQQGHHNEARTMLGKIYNSFTEGFNTADLQEAKVLLDQLTL